MQLRQTFSSGFKADAVNTPYSKLRDEHREKGAGLAKPGRGTPPRGLNCTPSFSPAGHKRYPRESGGAVDRRVSALGRLRWSETHRNERTHGGRADGC